MRLRGKRSRLWCRRWGSDPRHTGSRSPVLYRLSYVCKCLPWATSLRGALRSASYRSPVYPAVARSAPLPSRAGSRASREEVSPCPRHPRLSPQEASNCKIFSSPLKRNTRERGLQFYIWNISCPSDSRKGDHPFERPPPDFPLPLSRRRGTIFPAWRTWSISTGFIASISMPLPIAARRLVDAAKTFARTIPAALPQWPRLTEPIPTGLTESISTPLPAGSEHSGDAADMVQPLLPTTAIGPNAFQRIVNAL